jgi:alpha-galactosidase
VAFQEYGAMRDALNGTGREIYFSLCGWNNWCVHVCCLPCHSRLLSHDPPWHFGLRWLTLNLRYAPVGTSLGNSWRIAGDCNGWASIYNAIATNLVLAQYASPGGWNVSWDCARDFPRLHRGFCLC